MRNTDDGIRPRAPNLARAREQSRLQRSRNAQHVRRIRLAITAAFGRKRNRSCRRTTSCYGTGVHILVASPPSDTSTTHGLGLDERTGNSVGRKAVATGAPVAVRRCLRRALAWKGDNADLFHPRKSVDCSI